jgi:hypothetical protein
VLLERDGELEGLEGALDRAARGAGSVVLVSGEAGIGKTSLVRAFLRAAAHRATVLQGACDDLLTPRTLGPLRDAARTRGGPPAAALADGDRDAVPAAVLTELGGSRPTVLVLEDVHWPDDATLDVLRYVGRRVDELAAVIVVTFRDGEVGRRLQRVPGRPRRPVGAAPRARAAFPARGGPAGGRHRRHVRPALRAHRGQPVLRLRGARDGRTRRPRDGGRRGARPGAPPHPGDPRRAGAARGGAVGGEHELVPALLAEIEQAWLLDRPAAARAGRRDAGRAHGRCRCGTPARRAATVAARLGEPVEAFPGCPDELAAGIRGDWRAAAAAWQALGDPHAAALELAEGDDGARLAALTRLDELGARPAAARVRRDLRRSGVTVIPRGPKPTTRETRPGSPTGRSRSCACSPTATNAEIAGAARALGAHGRPPRLGRAADARRARSA